jgi:murein DD-endopeptidase MepM/ murein hydrolase activator NlpD
MPKPPVELTAHPEPELEGVYHKVQRGETLWRISRAYGIPVEEVALANGIEQSQTLAEGRELFIPGARFGVEVPAGSGAAQAPEPKLELSAQARLQWPLAGVLYARFGPRGETRHDGLDIAAPAGTLIRSSGEGSVLYSGEQRGYGHVVILQHPDGLVSLYAHNSENLVAEGARVRSGEAIARVGEASRTSGPHLHFEVREAGVPRDPLKYLPPAR